MFQSIHAFRQQMANVEFTPFFPENLLFKIVKCFCISFQLCLFFFHINNYRYIQADDGSFVAVCNVNITIRDVNNHAPKFVRDNYMTTIAENTAIGKCSSVDLHHSIDVCFGGSLKLHSVMRCC